MQRSFFFLPCHLSLVLPQTERKVKKKKKKTLLLLSQSLLHSIYIYLSLFVAIFLCTGTKSKYNTTKLLYHTAKLIVQFYSLQL